MHISIQRTHLHLLIEAEDKQALGRGMQGFQISAARHIKAALEPGAAQMALRTGDSCLPRSAAIDRASD